MREQLEPPGNETLVGISTHAPVQGATTQSGQMCLVDIYFNSRPPCGVRPDSGGMMEMLWRYFNSRTPCWVRPISGDRILATISTPAPHARRGATESTVRYFHGIWNFNSCTPCGARLDPPESRFIGRQFQLTHPMWDATARELKCGPFAHFNSRTP